MAIIAFSVEKSSCGNPRRRHFLVVTSSLRLAIKVEPENVSMGTLFVTQEFNHIFVNEVLKLKKKKNKKKTKKSKRRRKKEKKEKKEEKKN